MDKTICFEKLLEVTNMQSGALEEEDIDKINELYKNLQEEAKRFRQVKKVFYLMKMDIIHFTQVATILTKSRRDKARALI